MRNLRIFSKTIFAASALLLSSCDEKLTDFNKNPNGVDPSNGNPNMTLPTVMTAAALNYQNLNYGDLGGVVQHIQHDGWYTSVNHYVWSPNDWNGWYDMLRNNQFLYERSVALDYKFHQGVALTMRAFIFGTIADLWGDAPYSQALRGDESDSYLTPAYDSQEDIYKGVIEDLKNASALFATKDNNGYLSGYDVYFAGNATKWQQFSNTLLLRYYMRLSSKLPDLAKAGIESVYSSGVYMKTGADDAAMDYIGGTSANSWPTASAFDSEEGSNYRRKKPAEKFVNTLVKNNDPRLKMWIKPVYVRWVKDETLTTPVDEFIRKNGVIQTGTKSLSEMQLNAAVKAGDKFTRHYNPKTYTGVINDNEYVGLPAGLELPDYFNENPTPGQTVQNQHVSQLTDLFREARGTYLKARLATASETHFILAEAALKGWNAGSAATNYANGVKASLQTWGLDSQYEDFIAQPTVAFNNTLEQILEQKWISTFTMASESWFDYRRTGLPAFQAGEAAQHPVLPVRFIYGNNELNLNTANVQEAIKKLETGAYTPAPNSQWSKPWLLQGTGKPW